MKRPVGIRYPLAELGAKFMRREVQPYTDQEIDEGDLRPGASRVVHIPVEKLEEAHGLWLKCPKCFLANKGPVGTHHVMCWFEGKVPDEANPGPGRWTPSGTGLQDLTFVPSETQPAVSVLLTGGCAWHGYIIGGCATVDTNR